MRIELIDIYKRFGQHPNAVHANAGISIEFQAGSIHGLLGGALIGFAGAAYSLHVKLGWSHRHAAGFGWIALAFGAYLFGALRAAATTMQGIPAFKDIPVQAFLLLPFPVMILTLILFNNDGLNRLLSLLPVRLQRTLSGILRSNPPAALGTHFEQQ